MIYPFTLEETGQNKNNQVSVIFKPWKRFSCDTSFLIGYDKNFHKYIPDKRIKTYYFPTITVPSDNYQQIFKKTIKHTIPRL